MDQEIKELKNEVIKYKFFALFALVLFALSSILYANEVYHNQSNLDHCNDYWAKQMLDHNCITEIEVNNIPLFISEFDQNFSRSTNGYNWNDKNS